MPDDGPDGDIGPPFTNQEVQRIREILDKAGIEPSDHFTIPQTPDPDHPQGWFIDPNIPRTEVWENYNGQRGDETFNVDTMRGRPGCENAFTIRISESWAQQPAGLAAKFQLWSEFATVRAIVICLRNKKCRRAVPLGSNHATDLQLPNGKVLARANFVFSCVEI